METMGWLIIFIVLIVIELLTMGLTTIWFAGGALAALLMSVFFVIRWWNEFAEIFFENFWIVT